MPPDFTNARPRARCFPPLQKSHEISFNLRDDGEAASEMLRWLKIHSKSFSPVPVVVCIFEYSEISGDAVTFPSRARCPEEQLHRAKPLDERDPH
ncbi:hypothetical protein ABG768_017385 [Culter alburnus]|uniref:Uncharacterized protein n=1 Tax=Culter alburnus TaxID=194366 RepID=A0AAW1YXK4_CULAL